MMISTMTGTRAGRPRGRAGAGDALLALALLALMLPGLGCGGAPARPAAKPDIHAAAAAAGDLEAEAAPVLPFLHASATADSEDHAYGDALAQLEDMVYGPAAWARELDLPLHDPAVDPVHRKQVAGGRIEVTVGVARERLAAFLAQLAEQPWQAAGPAPLAADIAHIYQLHRERLVCERRQALLDEACSLPSEEEMAAPMDVLARDVQIRPFYADGVPLDAAGEPLRPLSVVVERVTSSGRRVPLVGLPLRVETDEADALAVTEAVSEDAGVARFAFAPGAVWSGELQVAVDWERLLGPLAGAAVWPRVALPLTGRETGVTRWSLMATERAQGQATSDGVFGQSLDRIMREHGAMPMELLTPQVMGSLQVASTRARTEGLAALADALGGRVDVLVVAEIDSEYASRMSTHHVWYEARGRAEVFDVWTGQRLAVLEGTVTASGVGDERASRAARTELAQKLAAQLLAVPPVRRGQARQP